MLALLLVTFPATLYLFSMATQNPEQFNRWYTSVFTLGVVVIVVLLFFLTVQIVRLIRQYRAGKAGSRLTFRFLVAFVLLTFIPVAAVYYFAAHFLYRGIDGWFNVAVESALGDALELGRVSLDLRTREVLKYTEGFARTIYDTPPSLRSLRLDELRRSVNAEELTLLDASGQVMATSTALSAGLVPTPLPVSTLTQLRQGQSYLMTVEPTQEGGLQIRVAVTLPTISSGLSPLIVQALYPIAPRFTRLADSVENAFENYQGLRYLRNPLKYSFLFILSLVVGMSLLGAAGIAFLFAHHLTAPISDLYEGTRTVASGRYGQQLPVKSQDELGFLVASFNVMTERLARAHEEEVSSQMRIESQRAYLETVLERLSSGVLTIDHQEKLRDCNTAASHILGIDPCSPPEDELGEIEKCYPWLSPLVEHFRHNLNRRESEWRFEVTLEQPGGRQVLLCRGAMLPTVSEHDLSYVIVFDDITALIKAQRHAAWGEVARRLAHEVKNPLTPIQLAAERLRHKYLPKLKSEDAELLERLTHTIIQQVETLKGLTNAFSTYASSPQMQLGKIALNTLVEEVASLYQNGQATIELHLDPTIQTITADANRLRQVLHNLIKNAQEACQGKTAPHVIIRTHRREENQQSGRILLTIQDNGSGIDARMQQQIFEPYVTTKTKGTGLGLAIVKKIIEEHHGTIVAENLPDQGALFTIQLPWNLL